MRIGIFYNIKQVTASIAEHLAGQITIEGGEAVLFSVATDIADVDRLLVLGGDGTILHSAQKASELDIPIVGVNYGTRGFLTEFERHDIDLAAKFILSDQPVAIKRSMLQINFNGKTVHCLNELAMLCRSVSSSEDKAVPISVELDGSSVGVFMADGLIVSTPTGSTAYSLSAGGSIMTPDCETFLLTPICAFSLRSRPIACPDKSVLSLSVEQDGAALTLRGDGIFLGEARKGDRLIVKKSDRCATFLTKDKSEFFRRLTKKIN